MSKKVYVEDLGKEFDLEKLEKQFGVFEYNNKPLYQIQDAYPDGLSDNRETWVYKSDAVDEEGNLYLITWKQINFETEDGSETCDWDDYRVTEY